MNRTSLSLVTAAFLDKAQPKPELRRRSNEDIILELMSSKKFEGMAPVFMIAAIRAYCSTLAANPAPLDAGTGLIDAQLWYEMAKETFDAINRMYEENREIEIKEFENEEVK